VTTTIGVIGTGNMGSALVKGWLRSPEPGVRLLVWDKIESLARQLVTVGPIACAGSLKELVAAVDIVLVVVKPKNAPEVLGAIAPLLRKDQTVVSSMAGVTMEWMRTVLGQECRLFRIMPNLGVELGVGAIAVASEPSACAAELEAVTDLFRGLGIVEAVAESLLDAVTAVSGSGPAFLALVLESLEDGAVAAGLPRATARRLVRQAAVATARLLPLHSDSPAELRARIASPGGAERTDTAAASGDLPGMDQAGLDVLEDRGVRSAFQQAVEAAVERSRQLREAKSH
jgi:pyrroline-5-carboxylate reductase